MEEERETWAAGPSLQAEAPQNVSKGPAAGRNKRAIAEVIAPDPPPEEDLTEEAMTLLMWGEGPHRRGDYPEQEWQLSVAKIFDDDDIFGSDAIMEDNQGVVGPDFEGNRHIRDDFIEYCDDAHSKFLPFTKLEKEAVELLATLRKKKCSLDTYNAVFEWHLRAAGKLRPNETLSKSMAYISRDVIMGRLRERYNYVGKMEPITKTVKLPHCKAKVPIVCHNPAYVLQSLLTDPRIKTEDYLFFNDDPFAPPPDDLDYIADLNTGLSYTATYKKLITGPNQILVPIVLYIDGAVTGQFASLSVTALKMALGITNRKYREKPHAWRSLGYVPEVSKGLSRGRKICKESGHMEVEFMNLMDGEGDEDEDEGEEIDDQYDCKAQDLHTILSTILEEYLPIQEQGIMWDFAYDGLVYKDVIMKFFITLVKCDTDEADKLCGSYTCRTANVKQLCRYCTCPTKKCDDPTANYPKKTQSKVNNLVQRGKTAQLKAMSQQFINNAFYPLRFGQHNDMGIHGATPMEMLHALLLGIFKTTREMLFEQCGETSQLALDVNGLSQQYGIFFQRQSDRDLPKTKFSKGIKEGKLMAKEFTGVLLLINVIFQSTEGRKKLRRRKKHFGQEGQIDDWSKLVELLITWECWLKSDRMMKSHVKRSEKKHRHIMYLLKKVGHRQKGMGLNTMKVHGIIHYTRDMIIHAVPMNFDTGADESGHKVTKVAAKLTQKRMETFDLQTCKRTDDFFIIELAEEEIQGRPLWDYFEGYPHSKKPSNPKLKAATITVTGSDFRVYYNDVKGDYSLGSPTANAPDLSDRMPKEAMDFLVGLQELVVDHVGDLEIRTEHTRNGLMFRGTPLFRNDGKWRDWVIVNWGRDWGKLPCEIWAFVDLSGLPKNVNVYYGEVNLKAGVYAMVESTTPDEDEGSSQLFTPILKDVANEQTMERVFYLADVEAFHAPVAVVPDIGGPKNRYFQVTAREKWSGIFTKWLESNHKDRFFENDEDDDDIFFDMGTNKRR